MGCHTWFYKPIEVTESYEKKLEVVKKQFEKNISDTEQLIKDTKTLIKSTKLLALNKSEESLKLYNSINKSDRDFIIAYADEDYNLYLTETQLELKYWKQELCNISEFDKATINEWYASIKDINYLEDNFYEGCDEHDIFRKYGYPNTILHSFKETLIYINNSINQVHFTTNKKKTIKKLKKFWESNPNGLITFG